MRHGGGKQKGASFERLVCRTLSLWMSNGKFEDLYWRSAMSGGRSTVAAAKGVRLAAQAGDISCLRQPGFALTDKFLLECKAYKDLQFHGLIKGTGHLADFWAETKGEAARYHKRPMLVAKQNQQPICVCLTYAGLEIFDLKLKRTLTAPKLNLYIVTMDDFLKHAVRPV